jgi:hypothetical protein
VIDDVDTHDLPRLNEPPRQLDIVAARHRVAGGMIVEAARSRQAHAGGSLAKYLSRVRGTRIERAHRDNRGADETVLSVSSIINPNCSTGGPRTAGSKYAAASRGFTN